MARRAKKFKDPFEGCPEEFKEKVNKGSDADVNLLIADTAKNQAALMERKKEDGQLKECREALKTANSQYKDGTKQNNAQIAYARSVLSARGKPAGEAPEAA